MRFLDWSFGRRRRRPSNRFSPEEVDHALLTLPELERAVILNHRLRGLTYLKIARRLGITTDEVEQILARALYHLTCALREIERERRP